MSRTRTINAKLLPVISKQLIGKEMNWKCWFSRRAENRTSQRITLWIKDENQQQTQPTYDAESRNPTRATLVGGECSHHCAIPVSPNSYTTGYVFKPSGTIGDVTVSAEVQQDGATIRTDFDASDSTQFLFRDGDNSSKTYIVSIKGDDIPEPDEAFVIKLVNPTGGARVETGTMHAE